MACHPTPVVALTAVAGNRDLARDAADKALVRALEQSSTREAHTFTSRATSHHSLHTHASSMPDAAMAPR